MVSFSDVCAEKRKYIARKIDGSLDLGGGGGGGLQFPGSYAHESSH